MKIALLHFRVYETDGVSLEMDKWRLALEKMGHTVLYISGSEPKPGDLYLDELDYRAEYNLKIHRNAFDELVDYTSKEELLEEIKQRTDLIYLKLFSLIKDNNIDMIVPNNVSSLGFNLAVGNAVAEIARNKVCKVVYHHHDFYFERERYSTPLFEEILEMLQSNFPNPKDGKHCVINKIAQENLMNQIGVNAQVVPNVFDFEQDLWVQDEYNHDLREKLGIKKNDIVFLQATRIVERKTIEVGFQVVNQVQKMINQYAGQRLYNGELTSINTKVHFVLAGMNELTKEKFGHLDAKLQNSKVEIHYINNIVGHERSKNEEKVYSLWDVYTMCDFITYPSMLEGWGNQLLEGLFAKKPIIVYEYPVFKTDIKQFGFNLVSIDTELDRSEETLLYSIPEDLAKQKAMDVLGVLFDSEKYQSDVDQNFEIAKENLSYQSLEKILQKVFN